MYVNIYVFILEKNKTVKIRMINYQLGIDIKKILN